MKKYSYTDLDAATLTSAPGSFTLFLKHYLTALNWEIVEEQEFVLCLKNANGFILKIVSYQDYSTLQGFRNLLDINDDRKGFPSIVQNSKFVVCEVNQTETWTLFANEFLFYLVLNSELYGFGAYHAIQSDSLSCFLFGKNSTDAMQKLFTNLGTFEVSNLSVAAMTATQIPWSTPISFSYDSRIDLIKQLDTNTIPLSFITVHETKNNSPVGFLPGMSMVSVKLNLAAFDLSKTYVFSNMTFSLILVGTKIFAFEVS